MNDMKLAALRWAEAGVKVVPLHWIVFKGDEVACSCSEGVRCRNKGKHPNIALVPNGALDGTSRESTVARFWKEYPLGNIGITPSPLFDGLIWFALDIDMRKPVENRDRTAKTKYVDGEASLARLEDDHDDTIPVGLWQESGGGGRHILMVMRAGDPTPKKPGAGLDIIGRGRLIVAAPSMHASGKPYRLHYKGWSQEKIFANLERVLDDLPDAPDWLVRYDPLGERARSRQGDTGGLRKRNTDLAPSDFRKAVLMVPNDERNYDHWLAIGMAIHSESGGEDWGLDLWLDWSAKNKGVFDEAYTRSKWHDGGFDASRTDGKSGKFILELVKGRFVAPAKEPWEREAQRFGQTYSMVSMKGSIRIAEQNGEDHADPYTFYRVADFHQKFAGKTVMIPDEKKRGEMVAAPLSKYWISSRFRKTYEGVTFDPSAKPNPNFLNLWKGIMVPKANLSDAYRGCSRFVDHIYDVVCRGKDADAEWVLGWLAHMLQRPWEKLGTAVVLQGKQGTGKSVIGDIMGVLLGPAKIRVAQPNDLVSNFNASVVTSLLVQAEEAFWAGDKRAEGVLRNFITAPDLRIEYKGIDAMTLPNYARLLITTNHEWAVPAGVGERRFAVWEVSDSHAKDYQYFGALWAQMQDGGYSALRQYLEEFDLKRVNLREIPNTEALLAQKLQSLPVPLKFLWQAIENENHVLFPKPGEPVEITTNEFRAEFEAWRSRHYRHDYEFAVAVKMLKPFIAGFEQRRFTLGKDRPHGYIYYDREACRKFFLDKLDEK